MGVLPFLVNPKPWSRQSCWTRTRQVHRLSWHPKRNANMNSWNFVKDVMVDERTTEVRCLIDESKVQAQMRDGKTLGDFLKELDVTLDSVQENVGQVAKPEPAVPELETPADSLASEEEVQALAEVQAEIRASQEKTVVKLSKKAKAARKKKRRKMLKKKRKRQRRKLRKIVRERPECPLDVCMVALRKRPFKQCVTGHIDELLETF